MKKFLFSLTLILWACFFILGQLGRINLTNLFNLDFSVAIYYYEIMIIFHLLLMLIFYPNFWINIFKKLIFTNLNFKKNFLINIVRLLLIQIFLSWIFAIWQYQWTVVALLYFLRFSAYLFFCLSFFFLRKKLFKKDHNKIINLIISNLTFLITLGFLFFGLYQIIFFPDNRILFVLGFDNHYYRLIGTLLDPNLISLIFITGFFITIFKKKILFTNHLKLYYLTLLLFFIGLVLTFSRSGLLAFAIAITYFILKKDRKKLKFFYLGILILALFNFAFQKFGGEGVNLFRTSTIKIRLIHNFNLLQKFQPQEYLLGRGFFIPFLEKNNVFSYYRNNFGDNLCLILISYGGIIALSTFIFIFYKLFFSLKNSPSKQATLIAYFIHSQFVNSFFSPFLFLIFFLFIFDTQ